MTAKDLKNALLQEAVQGKLVPQIASEGNAKDLLEEIKKEKAKLIKEGKLKKDTTKAGASGRALPEITEDEVPFDIPENWCWCRITDISTCELGKTKDVQKNKGELKDYLCSINIQEDGIDLTNVKQMKFEKDEFDRYTVKKDDLLICEGGDAGRCAIYNRETPMHYQNALHRVRFFKDINPFFYLYLFQLYKANNLLSEASKGVTIQHLTGAALKELCFPLPPISEQKRIVAAIEQFIPLIEEYGKKETELTALNADIAKTLKNAILQEAVQGKLAPQIASEGNAKDLLDLLLKTKKYLVEKRLIYKKSETEPFYKDDEYPFDIPDSWCWVKLSDISIIQEGAGIRKWQYRDDGTQLLCVTNILNGKVDLSIKKLFIDSDEYKEKYSHLTVNKGDIVCSCSGGSWGKAAIYNCDDTIMMNTSTLRLRFFNDIGNNKFLYYVVQSDFFKNQLLGQLTGMQPNFGYAHYSRICIPLPPLSEQERIVTAIEQLLPLCEKLGV